MTLACGGDAHGGAMRGVIITIDGPAGTGKSSVARRLAHRLGLEFLDTGAMYRAAALAAIERGIPPSNGPEIAAIVRAHGLRFDWKKDPPALALGDRVVMARLRDADVNEVVSDVSVHPEVRAVMVALQRQLARQHPRLVTEGRDQGSTVFPDAAVRFYLDAAPEIRARRRCEQLVREGRTAELGAVLRSIQERDHIDSTRHDAPLRVPNGATMIDTSDLLEDEVVERLEGEVRSRVPTEVLDAAAGGCCR